MTERGGPEPGECLTSTEFVDWEHPSVGDFVQAHRGSSGVANEEIIALYYAIRDGFYYSPWGVASERAAFKASAVLEREKRRGHCIDKAVVMAACARRLGVPSRLRFANVRNHIGTAEFEKNLGTDLLVFHGYCELHMGDRWTAATPAFNRALCEKLGVEPLEFNGTEDSIFQHFDSSGGRFMEYVHDYGPFTDIPYETMVAEWRKHYPQVARTGQWPQRPN